MRGTVQTCLRVGQRIVPAQERYRAALTLRPLIVAVLAVAFVAAAGSGRAGTAVLHAATGGSAGSASATVSATAITAGLGFSCALTGTGGVKCWGTNGHDELGDGSMSDHPIPVDVSGLSGGVTAIAAGVRHSCALTNVGGVKCWGYNGSGSLGDGTTSRRFTPVDVAGLRSSVTAIAAGSDHSCALTSSRGVECWGSNRFGELGDGTTSDRSAPVDVVGLGDGVTAIAAGGFHSCALMSAGGVKCWGGTTREALTPVDVVGLSGVTAIAAGSDSCALTISGGVKCWGLNNVGQLGDGTTDNRVAPVGVFGLSGVTAIAAGTAHNCALTSTRGAKCWGLNDNGQLGDGATVNRSTPVDVLGLSSGVTAIAAGGFHTCALTSTGGVKCWGANSSGELGDRTNKNRTRPVGVIGFGAARAALAVVSGSATVTAARVAAVTLRCSSQARCEGTLTLTTSLNGAQLKVGSRPFSIAAGGTHAVKVKLTARGFKLLVRVKRLSTQARITYKQPAGGTTTATRTITLTTPRP